MRRTSKGVDEDKKHATAVIYVYHGRNDGRAWGGTTAALAQSGSQRPARAINPSSKSWDHSTGDARNRRIINRCEGNFLIS